MRRNALSAGLIHQNFTIAIVQIIVLGLIALPLAGCGDDGQGGPVISSLSTPTDSQSDDGAPSHSNPTATGSPAEEPAEKDQAPTDSAVGMTESLSW